VLGLLAVVALCLAPVPEAAAQTLDELQVQTVKNDTVIRISFAGRIRYLRTAPTAPSDLFQVFFQMVSLDNPNAQGTTQEARVSPSDAPGPAFTVTYPFQANQTTVQIQVQFNTQVSVQVRPGSGGRSLEIVVKGGAKLGSRANGAAGKTQPAPGQGAAGAVSDTAAAKPAVVPKPSAAAPAKNEVKAYALTLQRIAAPDSGTLKPIPRGLENYEVFTSPLLGQTGAYEVNLGYFPDAESAEAVRQKVLATFPEAVVFSMEQRTQENLSVAATLPAAPAEGAAPAAVPADRQAVDTKAEELLLLAADAVAAKNYTGAVDLLNQVLLLPPNPSSQTAQELIGVAHERAGNLAGARADYESYIKLFPEGDGPDRVRQRLANLIDLPVQPPAVITPSEAEIAAGAVVPEGAKPKPAPVAAQKNISGSISQFYYGGQTRSTTLLAVPTGISQTTLTGTTQSALVTNIDATARYRDSDSDSRMVLRETNATSFLTNGHGTNLLSAAYIDYKNLVTTLGVRVGRQSAASAGALGLFDGIAVGYSISPRFRLNVSAGQPSDPYTASHQRFVGFDLQVDEVLPSVGVGVYGINQTVDGAVSRRAIGLEARYFTQRYSVYGASDYDTAFKATNSSMLQGTMTTENQEVVTLLYDHRRVPGLDLGNALIGSNYTSLSTMLQQLGYAQVQQLAAQVAAVSRQTVLSVSKPFTEHWQGSTDLRWSDVGALPAIGNAPAQPGTGSQVSYSLVATGSNLYSLHDTNVVNLTVLSSAQLRGTQLAYNNLTGLMENLLSLEPSLRYYVQNTNTGLHTSRWTPGVRASYRITPVASLETEAILELSKTTGTGSNEDTKNAFYYVGYRYDFR
jgi:tetratricopeptide (TPR) repeat protein